MGRGRRGLLGALAASLMLSGCWTQIGFGPGQRRYNPYEQGITAANVATLAPLWTVERPGRISEPVLAGGRVHFAHNPQPPGSPSFEALDAGTGETVWSRTLPSTPIFTLANGVTFSGNELLGGYATTSEAALLRLDPETGATLDQDDDFVASPVVAGDGVLAYARLGTAYDRVLVVRDSTSHTGLWTLDVPDSGILSFAIADGRIYVLTPTRLAAYPVAGCGGAACPPLWQDNLAADETYQAMAAGPDGTVVTTTTFRWIDYFHIKTADPSRVKMRDGATGGTVWSGGVTAATGSLAVDDDYVYVASSHVINDSGQPVGIDRLVAYAVDGCGNEGCNPQWSAPLPGPPDTPLVGGGVVYTNVGNDLYALDTDGSPLATFPGVGTPRSLGEGRLYTTTGEAGGTTLRALAPVS